MKLTPSYTIYIRSAAIISLLGGLAVMTGWVFNIEILKTVFRGFVSMKFNTSICFVLSGIILFFYSDRSRAASVILPFLSTLIALIGIISLAEDIFGFNTGLDELLFADKNTKSAIAFTYPGRLSTIASFSFTFLGFSFLLLNRKNKKINVAVQYAFHSVSLISIIAICGYLYNVPSLYKLSFLTSIALPTSVMLFILSIGASFINSSLGITGLFTNHRLGNIMARRLFPPFVVLIFLLSFLRLESHRYNVVSVEFGGALFTLSFLLISLLLISITAKYLDRIDLKRAEAEMALTEINKNLEQLVDNRTKELQVITERLSLATKGSKIGIWDWDIPNNKLTWDDKMYHLYGVIPSNFSGAYEAWENLFHPDDKSVAVKAIEQALSGEKEFDIEFRIIWPDHSIHYIKANALIQRDHTGKALRMIGTSWDITEQKEQQERLRRIEEQHQREILKAAINGQEQERDYISKELHDNINQILTSANLYLGLVKASDQTKTLEAVETGQLHIKTAIDEIQKLSRSMSIHQLKDLGILASMEDLKDKINFLRGCKVKFIHSGNADLIPPDISLTIFRISQEQLDNIIKHSRASSATISLDIEENKILLHISDNGMGANLIETKKPGGIGLSNIYNRIHAYNGNIELRTSPGKGFDMRIEFMY